MTALPPSSGTPEPPARPAAGTTDPGGDDDKGATTEELLSVAWHMGYDAAHADADRLRALLDEILAQFTEPGHPGRPCHRTGWVRDDHLAKWREAARQHGGTDG